MITREDLSSEQEEAFNEIIKFIHSPRRQMLLGGYAGCGKTALINVILEHLGRKTFLETTCTAPTNEAVRVISKLTGKKFNMGDFNSFETLNDILKKNLNKKFYNIIIQDCRDALTKQGFVIPDSIS